MSAAPLPGTVHSWSDLARRRWRTGAGVFVVVFGLAAALVLLARPIYRTEARFRLGEPPPAPGVSPNAGVLSFLRVGGDPFANDMELIESRTLTEGVVSDAVLNVAVLAPRGWYRDSLFLDLSAGRDTDEATYEAEWTGSGQVSVRMLSPTRDSVRVMGSVESPLEFGGVRATFQRLREGMPRAVRIKTVPFGEAVRITPGRIQAERARREANVVLLSFDAPDPSVSLAAVRSTLDRFVELRIDIFSRESRETIDSLQNVVDETRVELEAAEAAMERLQRESRLIDPAIQNEAFVGRYSAVLGRLETARIELSGITDLIDRANGAENPARAWAELVAYPRFLEQTTVAGLMDRLMAAEEQRTALAARRTPESRDYRVLTQQIADLDDALRAMAASYRESLVQEIGELESQAAGMDSTLAAAPRLAVEFGRRQRDVRLLTEVMVLTEQRLRQEQLRRALTFANVQVIDPPALRHRPVWPRKKLGLGVGGLMGMLFGLLAMAVRERADRTLRAASRIRSIVGAPVLAVVDARGVELGPTVSRRHDLVPLGAASRDAAPTILAPVGRDTVVAEAARAMGNGAAPGPPASAEGGAGAALVPARVSAAPITSYAAAAALADRPGAVVVVVRFGGTNEDDLVRAMEYLGDAGVPVAGAVVVCRTRSEEEALWR